MDKVGFVIELTKIFPLIAQEHKEIFARKIAEEGRSIKPQCEFDVLVKNLAEQFYAETMSGKNPAP